MQQRALRTREAILAAARAEFAAKGFHGARVDRISEKAGINKQRLYANFKSKSGLFAEVLKASFADLVKEEQHLLKLAPGDIPQLAERILACYVAIHTRHPDFWRLLAWENLEDGRHSASLTGIQAPIFKHLKGLYGQGQKAGHFHTHVPFEAFIFNLLAVSYFMVSNRKTLKQSIGLDLTHAHTRKTLCNAIVSQIVLQPPP